MQGARREVPRPARRYLTEDEVKRCDLSLTDEIRVYQELTLRVFQFLGMVAIIRRDDGLLEFKWISPQCFYCLFILAFRFYVLYLVTVERYYLMNQLTDRSFDEDLFLYTLHVFNLYEALPIALILESRKIAAHFNSIAEFQARYYHVKGTRIDLRLGNHNKYIYPLISLGFTLALFFANVINVRSVYKELNERSVRPFIENLVSGVHIILDLTGLHLLWLTTVNFMRALASSFAEDVAEAFRSGDDASMDNYEKLWMDLMFAVKNLGKVFTLSVGLHFILAVLAATFELYLAIRQDHAILSVYGISLWLSVIVFLVVTDGLIRQLSEELKCRLMDVKKEASPRRRHQINQFFRLMRGFDERVDLGGFTTINNGLATSVMNNITTYIIILVQFKQGGQNQKSGRGGETGN